MGQYYHPVNIDKMEHVYSHDYENGLKLMEHSYIGNNFVDIVERLLSPNGAWHKCRLCWAGDYMDAKLFLPEGTPEKDEKNYDINLYTFAQTRIKPAKKDLPKKGHFLVNHTKAVCLDLKKEKNETNWIIHPLPLLTCSGNGRGGGDYDGAYIALVGGWAGDVISIEHKPMYDLGFPIDFCEK